MEWIMLALAVAELVRRGGRPWGSLDTEDAPPATTWRVWATSEEPQADALGGYLTETDAAVALPARSALRRAVWVESEETGIRVCAPVRDVGPWHTSDPYWETGTRPAAELKFLRIARGERTADLYTDSRSANGTPLWPTNPAGIDLTWQLWRMLGIPDPRTHSGYVRWWWA